MQKGISENVKKLLIVLIGVAVLLICYLLLYQRFTEQRDAAESAKAALQPTLEEYRGYAEHMEEYRTKTATDKTMIANTLKRLPSEVKYEDMILYTDAMGLESNVGLDESSIGFTDPMLFLEFNGVTADNVDAAAKAVPMKAYRSSFSIESAMNYEALKKLITYVYTTNYYTGLESVSATYNPTEGPELNVSAVIDMYSLNYEGAPNRGRNFGGIVRGTPDVFAGTSGNTRSAAEAQAEALLQAQTQAQNQTQTQPQTQTRTAR